MEVSNSESSILISESFIKWVRMERYIEEVGMDMPVRGGDKTPKTFNINPSLAFHPDLTSYNQNYPTSLHPFQGIRPNWCVP